MKIHWNLIKGLGWYVQWESGGVLHVSGPWPFRWMAVLLKKALWARGRDSFVVGRTKPSTSRFFPRPGGVSVPDSQSWQWTREDAQLARDRARQKDKDKGRQVWSAWFWAHVLGFPLGLLFVRAVGTVFWKWLFIFVFGNGLPPENQYRLAERASSILGVVVLFLTISVAQQIAIGNILEWLWWLPVTLGGLLGGFALAWWLVPNTSVFYQGIFLGGTMGVVVGVVQWLILRRYFYNAGWWVVSAIAGFVATFTLILAGVGVAEKSLVIAWLLSPIVGGVFGLVSGAPLPWILRRSKN